MSGATEGVCLDRFHIGAGHVERLKLGHTAEAAPRNHRHISPQAQVLDVGVRLATGDVHYHRLGGRGHRPNAQALQIGQAGEGVAGDLLQVVIQINRNII